MSNSESLMDQVNRIPGVTILELMGHGSLGSVYKALDNALNRMVVVKILATVFKDDQEFTKRFLREINIHAKLSHPHIVQVYSGGEIDKIPYFIMEYIEGRTLADLVKEKTKLSYIEGFNYFRQILKGLSYLHDQGIIHRDIKPENILISHQTNQIKIIDFGIAKFHNSNKKLTHHGSLWGTPQYMSPEQAQGKKIENTSDLYSLGIVLYELLTGELPFQSNNTSGYLTHHIHSNPPSILLKNPNLPNVVDDIINKLLQKIQKDRFNRADEVLKYIEEKGFVDNFTQKPIKKTRSWLNYIALIFIVSLVFIYVDNFSLFTNDLSKNTKTIAKENSPSSSHTVVSVKKSKRGYWTLYVNNRPFVVRGVYYRPSKVGNSLKEDLLENWVHSDVDNNQENDFAFDSWMDENDNGVRDINEPTIGDFRMLKKMGANTLCLPIGYLDQFDESKSVFQQGFKQLMRDLYQDTGIRVIFQIPLFSSETKTHQEFLTGVNYNHEKEKWLENLEKLVKYHHNEPYLLLWALGNGDNLFFQNNDSPQAGKKYAKLVQELTKKIHSIDSSHPVAIVDSHLNDLPTLEAYKKWAPSVDIYAINAFMGDESFSNLWNHVFSQWDRPILIASFGTASVVGDKKNNESYHAKYLLNCWMDIWGHSSILGKSKIQNSIGGVVYSWLDCWSLDGDPNIHNLGKDYWPLSIDGLRHREWSGLMSQGRGSKSPFLRRAKQAYYQIQKTWLIET